LIRFRKRSTTGVIGPGQAEFQAAMGSASVVVGLVLGHHDAQVSFAEDQHPVGHLRPGGERGKNRMHLDLLVDSLEAEVTRLRGLGTATVTPVAREEFGQRWFVLADPEGNEFCVAEDPDR
jgi:predicted enzyme related to lactoylglutathione lyase